jgi:hypothetical protein
MTRQMSALFASLFMVLVMFVLVPASHPALAQDNAGQQAAGGEAAPPGGDALPGENGPPAGTAGGGPVGKRPSLDPFKALVEPKPEPVPVVPVNPAINAPPPPPPPAPPVNFKVNAVAGEHPNYVAVIEFEGQTFIVQAGTKVPDDQSPVFEVKLVTAEKVEVFDRKTNRIVQKQLDTNN